MTAGTFDRIDVIDGREFRVRVLPYVIPPDPMRWPGERTTRPHARRVACPKCGAPIGAPCKGVRSKRRQLHEARHLAAIDAGAPVVVRSRTR